MSVQALTEEIALIAEAGDPADALDLVRTLIRQDRSETAIQIRRTVTGGNLDRTALRQVGEDLARAQARVDALFTAQLVDTLCGVEAELREGLRLKVAMPPADARAQRAAQWAEQQRYAERVATYNAAVEKVNRARGLAENKRTAAAVRATTCDGCFQVRAANGSCGC